VAAAVAVVTLGGAEGSVYCTIDGSGLWSRARGNETVAKVDGGLTSWC
jgi:hypothetical protein